MAGNYNKVILIGRLGRDPEIRQTPAGSDVANFSIAITETWKKDGQKHEKTEWVNIVAWGPQVAIAQKYLRKGSSVHVEGKLQTRTWEDKNGGGKRSATEVLCDRFQMLDGPQSGGAGGYGGAGAPMAAGHGGDDLPDMPAGVQPGGGDDDLPFN